MHPIITLLTISGALLIGAVSPGPSFLLVSRTAIGVSRRDGLAMALGMGTGAVVFGFLVLVGLHALLMQVTWLYISLKMAGGAYLLYLAVKLWRGANEPLSGSGAADNRASAPSKSFFFAFLTQVSNPKTAIFYGSIFVAVLPKDPPVWMLTILPIIIFIVEAGWYSVVAMAFSSRRPRAAYLRSKSCIDRTASFLIGGLGLRLILDNAKP